ncbi:hypothetical protein O181_051325 [Austropuccinia psidii MF-1]|uniref:Endonuclease/exonuclease/phosphatase domain-containing protein n=1 Tax=Austropuccinia psidii MF-1 TaxID=1389203 RepID=A0A9Q3E2V8_9BASI|nr:hypothetical protein [Austropuccinia psidii MF-1]
MSESSQLSPTNASKLAQNHPQNKSRYKRKKNHKHAYTSAKKIQCHQIINSPQENTLLDVSISIPQLTLLSLYNPPTTFNVIQILNQWLQTEETWKTPTIIMMDSNLHHPLWNPNKYTHTHAQARDLIKICGKKGFNLISPKHIPTFLGAVGRPTTIDLTWASYVTQNLQPVTQVQLNNHSSDHHPA